MESRFKPARVLNSDTYEKVRDSDSNEQQSLLHQFLEAVSQPASHSISDLDNDYQAFKKQLDLLHGCYTTLDVSNLVDNDHTKLLKRIFEHPVSRIILLGDRSSGKSTLCNSLLGAPFSPVGVSVETLDTVHFVFAQDHPRYEVIDTRSSRIQTVDLPTDLGSAAKQVSELLKNPPTNALFSRVVRVHHCFPLLKHGIEIIDCPGLNADEQHSQYVIEYANQAAGVLPVHLGSLKSITNATKRALAAISKHSWESQRAPILALHVVSYWDKIDGSERSQVMRKFQHAVSPDPLCFLNLEGMWWCREAGPQYVAFTGAFQEVMGKPFHDLNLAQLLQKLVPFFRQSLVRQVAQVCLGLEWVARAQLMTAQENLSRESSSLSRTAMQLSLLNKLRDSLRDPNSARERVNFLLRAPRHLPPSQSYDTQLVAFLQQALRFNSRFAARGSPDQVDAVLSILGPDHIPVVRFPDGNTRLSHRAESVLVDLLAPKLVQDVEQEIAEQTKQLNKESQDRSHRQAELRDIAKKAEQQFLRVLRLTAQQLQRFALDPSQLPPAIWNLDSDSPLPSDITVLPSAAGSHFVVVCDLQSPTELKSAPIPPATASAAEDDIHDVDAPIDRSARTRRVAVQLSKVTANSLDSAFFRESFYRTIAHPNIVGYDGFCFSPSGVNLALVSELGDASLKGLLEGFRLTESHLYEMLVQILYALDYLHTLNLVHGGVSSAKILAFGAPPKWKLLLGSKLSVASNPVNKLQDIIQLRGTIAECLPYISDASQRLLGFVSSSGDNARSLLRCAVATRNPAVSWPPAPPLESGPRVLCLDGGGIKGLSALVILEQLEASTGKPIHELFDLVVGTSIGAIIAAGLTVRKLSATQMIKELQKNASTIFPAVAARGALKKLITNKSHSFPTGPLKTLLTEWFGNSLTSSLSGCKVAFVAKRKSQPGAYLFRSYEPSQPLSPYDGNSSARIVDALLASAAAPGTFRPHDIPSIGTFVDGGVGYNNPSYVAVCEAIAISGAEPRCLISVGCGQYPDDKPPSSLDVVDVASALGAQVSDSRDVDLVMRGQAAKSGLQYHRLSVVFATRYELDSVEPEKMDQLIRGTVDSLRTDLMSEFEAAVKTLG